MIIKVSILLVGLLIIAVCLGAQVKANNQGAITVATKTVTNRRGLGLIFGVILSVIAALSLF